MTIAQFQQAIENNDLDFVRASLIEHPEYLETKLSWNSGYYSDYPFTYATVRRKTDVMRLLATEFGVDINRKNGNSQGKTPMHYAAEYSATTAIETLLSLGAEVSPRDYSGQTPLDICNHAESQKKLIAEITRRWRLKKELEQERVAQNDDEETLEDLQKTPRIASGEAFKKTRPPAP